MKSLVTRSDLSRQGDGGLVECSPPRVRARFSREYDPPDGPTRQFRDWPKRTVAELRRLTRDD